jgi:LysR family cys regulon transcriptional activator
MEAQSLKDVSAEFHHETSGSFTIATTHTQARYALPPVVREFMRKYPQVRLSLRQGSPTQIAEQVTHGQADIAIATEALELYDQLVMLPCYEWNRCVVVPPKHPLLSVKRLTLEAVAKHPVITYDFAFTGRSTMQRAFEARGLTADIVLTAIDADVIKTYVELGLGVGIIAQMAFDPKRDSHLRSIDASHLFEPNITRIGIRRGAYLRGFAAPHARRDRHRDGDSTNARVAPRPAHVVRRTSHRWDRRRNRRQRWRDPGGRAGRRDHRLPPEVAAHRAGGPGRC